MRHTHACWHKLTCITLHTGIMKLLHMFLVGQDSYRHHEVCCKTCQTDEGYFDLARSK